MKDRYLQIFERWAIKEIKEHNLGYTDTWYFNTKNKKLILFIIKNVKSRSKFIRECLGTWLVKSSIIAGHIGSEVYILNYKGELIKRTFLKDRSIIYTKDGTILEGDL